MKKWLIWGAVSLFLPLFLILTIVVLVCGSDADKPITAPLTPEQAFGYYSIGQELGVPWDLIILVDTYRAEAGAIVLGESNPMLTALNFCKLEVKDFILIPDPEQELDPDEEQEIKWIWKEQASYSYEGTEKLLSVLNLGAASGTTDVFAAVERYEQAGTSEKAKREVLLTTLMPERSALEVIGLWYSNLLSSAQLEEISSLYATGYLRDLYMEADDRITGAWIGDVNLPDLVVGEVHRAQLIAVAASIVDAPYLLGGKSPAIGPPRGALDCSGFVDWVYVQAFGTTVSGGLGGTAVQFQRCTPIAESELQVGDLGFYYRPSDVPAGQYNHVGIYVGRIDGKPAFIHCGGPYWGYPGKGTGRVVVSINDARTKNNKNPLGGSFNVPAMNPSNFRLFMRPQFQFLD